MRIECKQKKVEKCLIGKRRKREREKSDERGRKEDMQRK